MRTRLLVNRWVITSLMAGVVALSISWIYRDAVWVPDLFVETGVALLLFGPLLVAGWRAQQRFDEMQKAYRETAARQATIDAKVAALSEDVTQTQEELRLTREELWQAVFSDIAEQQEEEECQFSSVVEEPTRANILNALERARESNYIAPAGCRVPIKNTTLYLRYQADPSTGSLWLVVEHPDGEKVRSVEWVSSVAPSKVLTDVADVLRKEGHFPGKENFEPLDVFDELGALLKVASSRGLGGSGLRNGLALAVQFCRPQWLITESYIVPVDRPALEIPIQRCAQDSNLFAHMNEKNWIDHESFSVAYFDALALFRAGNLGSETSAPT